MDKYNHYFNALNLTYKEISKYNYIQYISDILSFPQTQPRHTEIHLKSQINNNLSHFLPNLKPNN
jgi:hypothetical protein